MRYSALQNISLNLPRLAYQSGGSDEILFSNMNNVMELIAKLTERKEFF
jgi:ribonucleoside-triphosphate reductase (formate)